MSDTLTNLDLLYHHHARELDSFARRRSAGDDARDLVQETFLRLLQYPPQTPVAHPRAYLYRVTANVANDRIAAKLSQPEWVSAKDAAEVIDPVAGPEAIVETRDLLQHCLLALDELPTIYRHVFLLHRLDGLSQREISEALGIPQRTVERYIAKALAHCLEKVAC